MLSSLIFLAVCLLAFANGANDNGKGVAPLLGSETADYRTSIAWGTFATLLGSLTSIFMAQKLLTAFSGKGLVPDSVAAGSGFLLAVAVGAAGTVLLATLLGYPISTTHSLVGAMIGAGLLAAGRQVNVGVLTSTFLLPLVLSPVMAVALAALLYHALHGTRIAVGVEKDWCVCVGEEEPALVPQLGAAAMAGPGGRLVGSIDTRERCEERYAGQVLGVSWGRILDVAHFSSAGLVSFARGLNDTPKIAALLLVLQIVDVRWGLVAVGIGMVAGGLLTARRVTHTMGRRITGMNRGQGLAANLATGLLVIGASRMGVPVSTTHVSVGSLFGIGLSTRQANPAMVRDIALSWVITLPCAGVLAALTFGLLHALG